MAAFTPCNVLTTLNDYQQAALAQITQRFGALQRLAEILEKAGDFTDILNDFTRITARLVPIDDVSLDAYERIRLTCPMLGLPEASIDALEDLQTTLARAYSNLIRRLDLHQYNRMDLLQARLDGVIGKALNALGRDWFVCANAVCEATQTLEFSKIKEDVRQFMEIKSQIAEGRLPGNTRTPFTIVSESGAQKIALLKENRAQLSVLTTSEKENIQQIVSRQTP